MTASFIEHVNVTVSDPARTAALLMRLFGWHIRWQGEAQMGGYTYHVGDDRIYLAVYAEEPGAVEKLHHQKGVPLNHIGIVVDDLNALEARVAAEGLIPFGHGDYTPGKRFYFFDYDDIEYEIVSYAH